jgi:Mrp family chromosome partitioning ATPase
VSRIFDALKKSRAEGEPVRSPATPVLHPVRGAAAPGLRAPVEHLEVLPIGPVAPSDEHVAREMATLRVSLEGTLPARSPRSIMLVSAQAREGTSTVALQFAESLARESGARVLLVDANTRRSSPLLEAARAAAGRPVEHGALGLLPLAERLRGRSARSVAEIRDLLEVSSAGWDWMIVDGPALLESPEVAPLAAQLDGVVLVIRSGRTKRPVLIRALDLLRRSQANVLGSILNRRRLEIPDFLYRRI